MNPDLSGFFVTIYNKEKKMNKLEMKRKHIEEANILMEKRAKEVKFKESVVRDTTKKDQLKDKLMSQLKTGR